MKIRLAIWLGVDLVLASGLSVSSCLLRGDEVRAYAAWHDDPTTENRAALDKQRSITAWQHVFFAGMLWTAMAAITVPVVIRVSRRSTGHESQTPIAA